MSVRLLRPVTAALLTALLGAACADRDVLSAPVQPAATPSAAADLSGVQWTRLACPTDSDQSAAATVGPEGGSLAAGGVRVDFPAGAVADTQTFALRVVAGPYVDVELGAVGYEHYSFAVPVTVSVDLTRCGPLPSGLHAWYMDSGTQTLLEDMGGDVDLLGRTLRFRTPHFSGYTVAW